MIISDKHKFVFIHIPKCAGTSVRRVIETFDSREGKYTGRVDHHPELGNLDYVHIPLFTLRDYFQLEFEAIQKYLSFAVMRDPYARFASSVSQKLKKYSEKPIQKRSMQDIDLRVREIIEFLTCHGAKQVLLPPEYIHFQRQTDYIELDGKQVITSLYTVNQVNKLLFDVSQHTGLLLSEVAPESTKAKANQTKVFRNDLLRRVIEIARPGIEPLRSILSENLKQKVRDRLYVPRDKRMQDIFAADYIRDFIRDYYVKDISLYRALRDDSWIVSP